MLIYDLKMILSLGGIAFMVAMGVFILIILKDKFV